MSAAGLLVSSKSKKHGSKKSTKSLVPASPVTIVHEDSKTEYQRRQELEQRITEKHIVRILSWNICWGCMASDETSKYDKTAEFLAKKCAEEKRKGEDTCLENVCALIDSYPKLDIIGLQEANRIPDLKLESKRLEEMKSVVFNIPIKKSVVQIATFYNQNKFRLIGAMCGNLDLELDPTKKDARPYQIILLDYESDGKKVLLIVINLHNGKQYNNSTKKKTRGFSKVEIEETLSNCLNDPDKPKMVMGYIPNDGNITATLGETTIVNLYGQIDVDMMQVIALGDFNDNANKYVDPDTGKKFEQDNFFKGFSPFGIKLVGHPNPENTCCVGEKSLPTGNMTEYKFQGDYILASLNYDPDHPLTFKIPPSTIKTQEHLSSDHLAVYAELIIPNLQDKFREIPEETKEEIPPKTSYFSRFSFFPSSKTSQSKTLFGGGSNMNETEEEYYKKKYLIYKRKYLLLKNNNLNL
jgi:hypothetical protein